MKPKRKKLLLVPLILSLAVTGAWWALAGEAPVETRFNGAYRLEDGRLVVITPRQGRQLRYRLAPDGESRALYPAGELTYEAGPGWSDRRPVEVELTFELGEDGRPRGFRWRRPADEAETARRLPLAETFFTFPSGELTLRGKLVLPPGEGPFPVVVLVHGSGRESAVDTYFMPYLFAPHGIATLAFDKRGTGGSDGDYTQNFHLLAGDVLAAVEWLRGRPEIDRRRIHLAGFSQGGWIAPLAASRTRGIRSLLIAYGPTVPVTAEDRWGYVHALRQAGFGEAEIAAADRVNESIEAIMDHGQDRWDELARRLEEIRGEPWLPAVQESDSILGFLAATKMPLSAVRLYAWWRTRGDGEPFVDRLYDPEPTLAALDVPSLWIFGGRDSSMPTPWCLEVLDRLARQGRPVETRVYAQAEHGIRRVETGDDGHRRTLGYEPGYFMAMVDWLRRHSDLPALSGG
jgi:dienelactone hydrolase